MATPAIKSIVNAKWLYQNMTRPNIKILDGSWHMPATGRKPHKEFLQKRIPRSMFFDIDEIADLSSDLPHMLPTQDFFEAQMNMFQIKRNDHIVVYDTWPGLGPACRVYWTFKVFGHENVSVLDGGLDAWIAESFPVHTSEDPVTYSSSGITEYYKASFNKDLLYTLDQVLTAVKDPASSNVQIVDARPAGRFKGVDPEPRPGLSSGHMPGALNIPFTEVITSNKTPKTLRSVEELRTLFESAQVNMEKPIAFSCGTGVTASILFLASRVLNEAGLSSIPSVAVYDGSWSEYGRYPEKCPAVKDDL